MMMIQEVVCDDQCLTWMHRRPDDDDDDDGERFFFPPVNWYLFDDGYEVLLNVGEQFQFVKE